MTDTFAELRRRDFSRLDSGGHVYLDYTGAGLYAESQVRAHAEYMCGCVLGNPHSRNPSSMAATTLVEGPMSVGRGKWFRARPPSMMISR